MSHLQGKTIILALVALLAMAAGLLIIMQLPQPASAEHTYTTLSAEDYVIFAKASEGKAVESGKQASIPGSENLHLLLEIPDKEQALEGWTEEDLIGRLLVFGDEYSTKLVLGDVAMFRQNGNGKGITEIAERVRARLFDLSVFMKELKLKMTVAYNFAHGRKGTLWDCFAA